MSPEERLEKIKKHFKIYNESCEKFKSKLKKKKISQAVFDLEHDTAVKDLVSMVRYLVYC